VPSVFCVERLESATSKTSIRRLQRTRRKARHRNIPLDNSCYNDYYRLMAKTGKAVRKARTPKGRLEEEVFISLIRTADAFIRGAEGVLKPAGLSGAQYNVLRILRGAGAGGLACREIGGRLISRDPDITRLLDRMESRGLIARARELEDRRVVKTRITAEGLRILGDLDGPVHEFHHKQLRRLAGKQLRQLLLLLERARAQAEAPGLPECLS
jgi:DNA-binding MarR family transcriptional regulator